MRVAIIGAGLAGLACARAFAGRDTSVTLFEKSRGYGGRMATRRGDGGSFDHGLPGFDPLAYETVDILRDLPEWGPDWRKVGIPTMNALPRVLGGEYDSHLETRIAAVEEGRTFSLIDTSGNRFEGFDRVALAIPAPQAKDLLTPHGARFEAVKGVTYAPGWALMLSGFEGLPPAWDACTPTSGPIALVIREAGKPDRAIAPERWTVHATRQWSGDNLERDAEDVIAALCPSFEALTGLSATDTTHKSAHRWRFSQPENPIDVPFLLSADRRLGACGDWCGSVREGGDARAAWASGAALAEAMM